MADEAPVQDTPTPAPAPTPTNPKVIAAGLHKLLQIEEAVEPYAQTVLQEFAAVSGNAALASVVKFLPTLQSVLVAIDQAAQQVSN